MSTTDQKPPSKHGMTEEQWLACSDPLRMPKVARDRITARKCCLLACANLLNAPGVLQTAIARRTVEIIQTATNSAEPGANLRERIWGALCGALPGYFSGTSNTQHFLAGEKPELAPDQWVLNRVLVELVRFGPTVRHRGVTSIASLCFAAIRATAHQEARTQIEVVRKTIVAKQYEPGTQTRDAVLELFPETMHERLLRGRWLPTAMPGRVTYKLASAFGRPRIENASARMVEFIRDILGNPFRPIEMRSEWREWNNHTAVRIANHIATTGNYADVPILGDALEDAGCHDEEMLRHCRLATHVPGCWVVDAVLGKA
jgi:hypothetical protein